MGEEIVRRVIRSEIKGINEQDFTVDVIMSDETVDRYKEVIRASAWKKRMGSYKEHPVLLSSHNYHGLMNQIGEAPKIGVKDNALKATFKYYAGQGNPEADWAWVLASKGVAAYSVGFIRHAGRFVDPDSDYKDDEDMQKWQKAGVRYVYDEVELLECSHVTVPANPSCLQNSFDQGIVMRSLEEKAFPMLAELEEKLKSLALVPSPSGETDGRPSISPVEEKALEIENKKWEETDNEIRHRVREPNLFKEDSFRYITLKKDKPRVRAVVGKLKDEDSMKIQSLRFPKPDGWTMEEAKAWVKEHPDAVKSIEEEEMIMGIDDLKEMVDELRVKFQADSEENKKIMFAALEEALKKICDEIARKTIEALDAELAKRKEKEIEEVVGDEKIDELENAGAENTDGVLDVFKSVTEEMEKTFAVQS